MKSNLLKHSALGVILTSAICASAINAQAADADHLVLSELSAGGLGEFIEIYNPTASPVPLDDYYVSDHNNYSKLPQGDQNGYTTDNFLQFPPSTTLQPGQAAVLVAENQTFLDNYFGGSRTKYDKLPQFPLLFEVNDSNSSSADDMILHSTASPNNIYNLTNPSDTNGEYAILFHWDGITDLVQNCDIILWGHGTGSNTFSPLTASSAGANGTTYNAENGTADNLRVTSPANEILYVRTTIDEIGEATTGGNGITGHDESTETNSSTWAAYGSSAQNQSPGVAYLGLTGQNKPPTIGSVERNIQNPTSTDTITITVTNAADSDGTIGDVTIYTNTTQSGTYTANAATAAGSGTYTVDLGPYADNTVVYYYAVATDDDGSTVALPGLAASGHRTFVVEDTPVQPGDIVINEIVANDHGAPIDAEAIELYNRLNRPVDISNYHVADNNDGYPELPDGTIIAANGYVVLALDVDDVRAQYPSIPLNVPVVDWGDFGLNNGGDQIKLVGPNQFFFNGSITGFADEVDYTTADPWPLPATAQSIELTDPSLDNNDGSNWVLSIFQEETTDGISTLGQQNGLSGVNDWNLY